MSDAIRTTIAAYVDRMSKGDTDGWVALFTDDARQEDPVGQPPNVGHDAIRTFFENVKAVGQTLLELERDPIILGNEAIVFLSVTTKIGDATVRVPFIADHMTFAEDGRISSLRAFFDPATITTSQAPDS